MFNTSTGLSPADVMALGNGNNDGWGNGSWIWFLIVIFALFGWGNGFGNNNNAGATDNYVLASDFSQLSRQMDNGFDGLRQQGTAIANGLSSLGYDQLARMDALSTTMLQGTNTIQSQISSCCCDNREAIAGVNYNMATQANGINNAITSGFCQSNYNNANNTRDIVDSQNAGTQAILAKLNQMESSAKDDKIAELTALNSDLKFQASQVAQNQFIQNVVKPPIQPCYVTQNPYCSCGNAYYSTTYGTTVS